MSFAKGFFTLWRCWYLFGWVHSGIGLAEFEKRTLEGELGRLRSDLGEGTGLGLSMIYGFLRQSRGHTTIDSEPGDGTRVTLQFDYPRQQQV